VKYATPGALRAALDQRLVQEATASGRDIARLRRRIVVERLLVRFANDDDGQWVLKGGVAVEVRLPDKARRTRDIDFARRGFDGYVDGDERMRGSLIDVIQSDPQADLFEFRLDSFRQMRIEGMPGDGWRASIDCRLNGRTFDRVTVDVVARTSEVERVERVRLPGTLSFAGVPTIEIVAVDLNQHFAEKLHAMVRDYGERQSSRVKDLVDLVLFIETGLEATTDLRQVVGALFLARGSNQLIEIPDPPVGWDVRYAELADEIKLTVRTIDEAMALLREFWSRTLSSDGGT